jgi:hypothetical protein
MIQLLTPVGFVTFSGKMKKIHLQIRYTKQLSSPLWTHISQAQGDKAGIRNRLGHE